MSRSAPTLHVDRLPEFGFGRTSPLWWATVGLLLIEGTAFVIVIVSYFYLRSRVPTWPPGITPLPSPLLGTINTVLLLVSCIPNQWVKTGAEKLRAAPVRIGLPICFAFNVAFLIVRIWEFGALHVRWDTNAYGSIVWLLMGLHTTHLVTDAYDTGVLMILILIKPIDGRRFGDVSENAFYWYFVVLSWIPIYLVIYFAPRLL